MADEQTDAERLADTKKHLDKEIASLPEAAQVQVSKSAQKLREFLRQGTQNERIIKHAALQLVALDILEPDYDL